MTYTVEQIARVCHKANRALQQIDGDPAPSPAWTDAPEWQRESAIQGVDQALNGVTPEQLHESWCEHKRADGWTYGPVKDAEAKIHPCLVPYDQLPRAASQGPAVLRRRPRPRHPAGPLTAGWNAMTPEQVRERVAAMTPLAQDDPERYHGQRDQLLHEVLTAIRDQHPDPAALAAAALSTDDIRPAWEACA